MSMAREMSLLTRWDDWANRKVLAALQASQGQPPLALAAFQHVLAVEVTWLRRAQRAGAGQPELWSEATLQRCEEWLDETSQRLLQLGSLSDDELEEEFVYQNSAGKEFHDVLQRSMLHMLLHSAQYRGEAAGFLNHSGQTVGDLDYIGWLRVVAPHSP